MTVGFDMRGRNIRNVPKFVVEDTLYENRGPGALPQPAFTATDEFSVETATGSDNQVLGVVGGKFNLFRQIPAEREPDLVDD